MLAPSKCTSQQEGHNAFEASREVGSGELLPLRWLGAKVWRVRRNLGVVQEIDSAAMHGFARWQHQDLDVDLLGFNTFGNCVDGCRTKQSFDSLDLFQVGGVIFF